MRSKSLLGVLAIAAASLPGMLIKVWETPHIYHDRKVSRRRYKRMVTSPQNDIDSWNAEVDRRKKEKK